MTTSERYVVGPIILTALAAAGLAVLRVGVYGWTIFVVCPLWIGALAAWVVQPSTASRAARPQAPSPDWSPRVYCWSWASKDSSASPCACRSPYH